LSQFPVKEWLTGYDMMHIPHNFEYVHCPARTIVTLHDALFMKIREDAFSHDALQQQVPPLMHRCKTIVTCSEYSRQDIIQTMNVPPDKITVIPWGIRHDVFYPVTGTPEVKQQLSERFGLQRDYFFSVSCSMERKNTPRLIDVYIKLAKQGIRKDLCLVWNAPASIREQVNRAGLSDRIHFLYNLTDDELRLLYAGATATVFPSLYEGFGLPVLESMACGTPVICSNVTSLPEVGGDVAVYIDPLDNDSIAAALVAFDTDQYDVSELACKGIRHASAYTWERSAAAMVNIYKDCLS
jgi:glycosyltransferase involved in cell wall biosynthesis